MHTNKKCGCYKCSFAWFSGTPAEKLWQVLAYIVVFTIIVSIFKRFVG